MEAIEIQIELKRINRNQKYLGKIFREPDSHISKAINLPEYAHEFALREKIIKHIKKLKARLHEADQDVN